LIVSFKGAGPGATREDVRAACEAFGTVSYIDFTKDAEDGFVRFADAESAAKAAKELAEAKMQLGGKEVALALVDGEDEVTYWKRVEAMRSESALSLAPGLLCPVRSRVRHVRRAQRQEAWSWRARWPWRAWRSGPRCQAWAVNGAACARAILLTSKIKKTLSGLCFVCPVCYTCVVSTAAAAPAEAETVGVDCIAASRVRSERVPVFTRSMAAHTVAGW
jgi:hypothetical protein